ncbi:MAG: hypothetical protein C4292_05445 [Nitrososphaera sp.]
MSGGSSSNGGSSGGGGSQGNSNDYPLVISGEGIKIKTDKMATEKLYHCVYEGKVYIFFKDEMELLHCYEVENPDVVKEIAANPADIEGIIKRHADSY